MKVRNGYVQCNVVFKNLMFMIVRALDISMQTPSHNDYVHLWVMSILPFKSNFHT